MVNDWLLRQGPTEQFDFNYQPIANNIKVKWVINSQPSDYYSKDEKLEPYHFAGTLLVFLGVYLAKKNYETKT